MGLHTGEPVVADESYVGMDVHRAARIAQVGHGGQVLLSETTTSLIQNELPERVDLLELGRHRLKGIPRPELIFQLEIDELPAEFPPLKSEDAGLPPHNLPTHPSPFVGRISELEALEAQIANPDIRLISIVAPGGMGKTRIALAAAEKQVHIRERTNGRIEARFPHGVFVVPLAPLDSIQSIIPAIAEAINFQIQSSGGLGAGGDPRSTKKQLLDYLASKRMLLVMDNFEHLLEGAGLLSDILGSAPEIKLLVTSRENLRLTGEHLFPLMGMNFPEEEEIGTSLDVELEAYSALTLFLQVARRMLPKFNIQTADLGGITSVCRLVSGMPLGIELAASWVNVLTVDEIAKEIQNSLDFLETKLGDVDERHRSIRAVFDSTLDRLEENKQELFENLSVFQGGFTRDAADQITRANLDVLGDLSNRSLLQFDWHRGRYEVHELLRQFGAERLAQDPGKEESIREKHSIYFCNLATGLETALKGAQHVEAMAQVDADYENILTGWRWAAAQGKVSLLAEPLEALDVYFLYSGRREEGETAFQQALDALPRSENIDSLRLVVRLKNLLVKYVPRKRIDQRRALVEENWERLKSSTLSEEDARLEEVDLILMGGYLGQSAEEMRNRYLRAYSLVESLGDQWKRAQVLARLGDLSQDIADHKEGIKYTEQSLAIYRELGFGPGISRRLNRLSALVMFDLDYDVAERYIQESMEISEQLGDRRTLGWTLLFDGYVKISQGRFEEAERLFYKALDINGEVGNTFHAIHSKVFISQAEIHLGRYQEALVHLAESKKEAEEENFAWLVGGSCVEQGRALMGAGDYREAQKALQRSIEIFKEGDDIGYLVYALSAMGIIMYELEDYEAMREVLRELFQIVAKIRALLDYLNGIPPAAFLRLYEGNVERAIELCAYAMTNPEPAESQWFYDVIGKRIDEAAATLSPEVVDAAQERGRNLVPEEVIDELLVELEEKEG
jgi:predicted ATPase